jgi:hypothetical protein
MKNTIEKLKDIIQNSGLEREELNDYFKYVAVWILKLTFLEQQVNDDYFKNTSLEELRELNKELYEDILPENYERSYANPEYAVKLFGLEFGQLLSALYARLRNHHIYYGFRHHKELIEANNRLFIKIYEYVSTSNYTVDGLKELYSNEVIDTLDIFLKHDIVVSRKDDIYSVKAVNGDLTSEKYLYSFGDYISENEIRTSKFLSGYEDGSLQVLAESIIKAYLKGFQRENKSMGSRKSVDIFHAIGREKLLRFIITELEKAGLQCGTCGTYGTSVNKQYGYDHCCDSALYLNDKFLSKAKEIIKLVGEEHKDIFVNFSGMLFIESFGEVPFTPIGKAESIVFSEEQVNIEREYNNCRFRLYDENMPESEVSRCVLALPSPEIGDNFEEVFADTCSINMLDSDKYEVLQQRIIDALDKGEYVHIKGSGRNETDIMVKLHELINPDTETNFFNSGADINIPVGEVYTSPMLAGTNGLLHAEEAYLGIKYENLKLTFKNGYISEYSCSNFPTDEQNKKYIEGNLLYPHKSLPMGEFAIGTNTLAYATFKKHGIMDKLPEVMIEKMGPHFAVGDTCFASNENRPVYNPLDGKEMIARYNEKSVLRRDNPKETDYNKHLDITLPYDAIAFITVITNAGESIDVIRDGRFVLSGVEELNEVIDINSKGVRD